MSYIWKCIYHIFQEFGLEWNGMILREENMMVPTKEHSILNAGELIPIVNVSCVLAIWLWENALGQFFRQILLLSIKCDFLGYC